MEEKYGNNQINKVKAVIGKKHDYLAVELDYSNTHQVIVHMTKYVKHMGEDFPDAIPTKKIICPWSEKIFKVDESSKKLLKEKAEQFHTFVAKRLFLCK